MGEVIAGRYELVDLIGQGAMGSVWEAVDLRSGESVALKVLLQSEAADLLRFVRETSLRFDHDHVVVPLGWVAEDDKVAFAMPLVRGGSVADLMKDVGAVPWAFTAEVMRQVAMGLAAVHGAGYVHRDIKPANVLLAHTGDGRPHAMLGDFGVAVETEGPRLTRHAAVIGTPGYLAPEVESGHDPVLPSGDLYALGAMARTMLTNVHPSKAGPMGQPPTGVPRPLWLLIGDLVNGDPAKRPASAEVVVERLADPDLAWRASDMGKVTVPDRLSGGVAVLALDRTGTGVDDGATRVRLGGSEGSSGTDDSGTHPVRLAPASAASAAPDRAGAKGDSSSSGLRWAFVAGLLACALAAGLLVGRYLVPSGDGSPQAGPATSPAVVGTGGTAGFPSGQIAPVWIWGFQRLGGECLAENVGKLALTADHFPLICRGATGGKGTWVRLDKVPTDRGSATPVPSATGGTTGPGNFLRVRPDGDAPCGEAQLTRFTISSDGYPVQCQGTSTGKFVWVYLTAYPTPSGEPSTPAPSSAPAASSGAPSSATPASPATSGSPSP